MKIGSVTRAESETIVGEDQFKVPVVDCPEVSLSSGRSWANCLECGEFILHETNGKQYYHKLACSKSNGIGYGAERQNKTLPHHISCDCLTCQPPKAKK